ncbi:major facilitator superfamily domain-containing protein 6-like [Sphaeramia orbicularis]|uniref:Major facilitator superfamily associated domain-containing protein n=1 Tax=Sphaeramia orbicularis TaxID=375764 RepID=A0A673BPJ6_9TELE|nr:major facilitator superfamily domain-containing protein 6-like [Sphaeramia orbicularis]
MKRNKQINIKRALALAGAFNFLLSCARGCLLPFLTLYFRQLGLTPTETGIVMGTKYLICQVWSPVGSLLSKHYNKRRVVINGCLVGSAAVALLLPFIPPVNVNTMNSTCNTSELKVSPTEIVGFSGVTQPANGKDSVSHFGVTFPVKKHHYKAEEKSDTMPQKKITVQVSSSTEKTNTSTSFHISNPVPARNERSKTKDLPKEKMSQGENEGSGFLDSLKGMDIQHQLFFLILIAVSVWEVASAPLDWTMDDGLYEYLDFADAADRHSSAGVWGLLGTACGVGGTGLLVSQLSCRVAAETPRSVVHFFCYAGLAALTLPVVFFLPLYLNKKHGRANGLLKAVQLVRGSPRALLCAITTLLVGMGTSAVDNFLLWQMQDHRSTELHMGFSLALGLLSQLAFPLIAGRLSKVLSPARVLTVGAASLGVQCFYYSFLWGPWAVLPAQVLSCFSGGALWWAVQVQCDDVATPGAERSVRRVYTALSLDLGRGLGSFTGGFVAQRLGLVWLFRLVALGLMVWCVCLPLLQFKAPRQRRINYSRLLAADASEASDSESEQERDWLDKAMEDGKSNNNYGRRISH